MPARRFYPWSTWFSRKRFKLVQDTDYFCSPRTMAQQVRNAAVARGCKVSISIAAGVLSVEQRGA